MEWVSAKRSDQHRVTQRWVILIIKGKKLVYTPETWAKTCLAGSIASSTSLSATIWSYEAKVTAGDRPRHTLYWHFGQPRRKGRSWRKREEKRKEKERRRVWTNKAGLQTLVYVCVWEDDISTAINLHSWRSHWNRSLCCWSHTKPVTITDMCAHTLERETDNKETKGRDTKISCNNKSKY